MTNYFTGNISGYTLTITGRNFSNENFYDQDVEFKITGKIDKTKNYKQYLSGEYLIIPLIANTVRTVVDGTKHHICQNNDVLRIWYPFPDGTVKGQVFNLSSVPTIAEMQTQSFLEGCFYEIKDGKANSTLEFVSAPDMSMGGLAGFIKIKITSNISGEEIIKDVPVTIIDDSVEVDNEYALQAKSFTRNIADVPAAIVGRRTFLDTAAELKAWKIDDGTDVTDAVVVSDHDSFLSLSPLIAAVYRVGYILPITNLSNTIDATIEDPNIQFSGNARYCEGDNVHITATYQVVGTPEIKWYDPQGVQITALDGSNILTLSNVTNSQSGFYTFQVGSGLAAVYVSVATDKMYWSTNAVNYNWNDPQNWVDANGNNLNAVPSDCTEAVISGSAGNYPNLADVPEGTMYDTHFFGNPTADKITIKDRGMLANTHRLDYKNASVEVNLTATERNRWVMYSAPLRKIYSGDFMLLDQNNKPKNNPPAVYMSFFQTDHPDNWGPGTIAKEKTFTKAFGNVGVPLPLGKAFNVWVDADVDTDTPFKFPSIYEKYDYNVHGIWGMPMPGQTSEDLDRTDGNNNKVNGRFITEDVTLANDGSFSIIPPDDTNEFSMVMVSNPYLAYLDMTKFLEENAGKLQTGYKIWSGKDDDFISFHYTQVWEERTWVVDNPALNDYPSISYVAPLQSFIVSKTDNIGKNTVELTYKPESMTTTSPVGVSGNYELRSVHDYTDPKGLLRINVKFDGHTNSTVLINTPGASNQLDENDSPKLFYDGYTNVSVYTITPDHEPLAINVSGDYLENEIPIGIRLKGEGMLEFDFTGIERFGYEVVLKDGNNEIELNGHPSYITAISNPSSDNSFYEINDRFSLIFPKAVEVETGIGSSTDNKLNIWTSAGCIFIDSEEIIHSVDIYNNTGNTVYSDKSRLDSYTVEGLQPNEVYIVKVLTSKEVVVKKVIVKY